MFKFIGYIGRTKLKQIFNKRSTVEHRTIQFDFQWVEFISLTTTTLTFEEEKEKGSVNFKNIPLISVNRVNKWTIKISR